MNSHIDQNENDDVSERFHSLETPQPTFYEETVTTIKKEDYTNSDDMARTTWDRTPIRRVNVIGGPQSAFARLFPDKYRQEEEEEFRNKQRSKSSENQRSNRDRITIQHTISDDEEKEETGNAKERIRKSRRVKFHTDEDNSLKTRIKSEPYLNQLQLNNNINYDPDPEIIYRDNPDDVIYTQKVGVRYLKPPTPPPPGPILIREIQSTPPKDPSPLVVSTTPPIPPRTPSPIIVREQPPTPPEYQAAKVITKTLPPPPTAPRRVIIKRVPPLPAKPRPVIIEKWLPYRQTAERPVLYQRAEKTKQTRPIQRNLILQYDQPRIQIKQELQNFGCFRVDPAIYRAQHGTSLRRTESIRKVLKDIGCDIDLITSTGYNTCYSSSFNQNNHSSHYDCPRKTAATTTCFTDEQLDVLIGSSVPTKITTESHYDIPRVYDDYDDGGGDDDDYYDIKIESTV